MQATPLLLGGPRPIAYAPVHLNPAAADHPSTDIDVAGCGCTLMS